MIPNTAQRVVDAGGVAAQAAFSISEQDSAHIMTILRDTLYSDKILAVLREYSSNAWDAHRMSGKPNLPIKVTMPTALDSTLRIRDFGNGLSQSEVLTVYTQYGRSTKRDSDTSVGMLGIGSKSGFAYTDSFTIVSWNGGFKKSYVAVLDAADKGFINLLHSEPCGEETGVEIQIAIKPDDISDFNSTAQELFKYFSPRPDINLVIPPLPEALHELKDGMLFERSDEVAWIAVMGCVPYKVNVSQISDKIGSHLDKVAGVLFFDIGEVEINASREELKYSDKTKDALVQKISKVIDDYVTFALASIKAAGTSPWDIRLRSQTLRRMGLPVPDESKSYLSSYVNIKGILPSTMNFHRGKSKDTSTSIVIEDNSRIIIRDKHASLERYVIGYNDYVLRYDRRTSPAELKQKLDEFLETTKLTGIPILKLSDMPASSTSSVYERKVDKKHLVSTFEFIAPKSDYVRSPRSLNWEIKNRVPTDDDVFVILSSFEPVGFRFYEMYIRDAVLAEFFGINMPAIYGYKTTSKNPVTKQSLKGMQYDEWHRTKLIPSIDPNKVREVLDLFDLREFGATYEYNHDSFQKRAIGNLVKGLGRNHALTHLLIEVAKAKNTLREARYEKIDDLPVDLLTALAGKTKSNSKEYINSVYKKYPLLTTVRLVKAASEKNWKDWLQYITLIDAHEGALNVNAPAVHDDKRDDHGGLGGKADDCQEGDTTVRGSP